MLTKCAGHGPRCEQHCSAGQQAESRQGPVLEKVQSVGPLLLVLAAASSQPHSHRVCPQLLPSTTGLHKLQANCAEEVWLRSGQRLPVLRQGYLRQ